MTKIIIHGYSGKMGQVVAHMAAADPELQVVAGIDKFVSTDDSPFPVYQEPEQCEESADVVIDFSVPSALPGLLEWAGNRKLGVLIATTGLTEEDHALIESKSAEIPIFISANMSLGINLMTELIQRAAKVLGTEYDIEIIEKHHNQKIDSPSGTAYTLADAINSVFLDSKHYIYGRHSKNDRRFKSEIGIHSVRAGSIVGEHSVLFAGKDEVLEIVHTAYSKQIFAVGALTAAKYLANKEPGLYGMKDMMAGQSAVTNIDVSSNEVMLTIGLPALPKNLAAIFKALGDEGIVIDMISQTAPKDGKVDISFTLSEKDLDKATQCINSLNTAIPDFTLDVLNEATKLTIEGMGMERESGVAGKFFEVLSKQDVPIRGITTSETKISCIIDRINEKRAVEAVIDAFGL